MIWLFKIIAEKINLIQFQQRIGFYENSWNRYCINYQFFCPTPNDDNRGTVYKCELLFQSVRTFFYNGANDFGGGFQTE